jgi:hypothetical protein
MVSEGFKVLEDPKMSKMLSGQIGNIHVPCSTVSSPSSLSSSALSSSSSSSSSSTALSGDEHLDRNVLILGVKGFVISHCKFGALINVGVFLPLVSSTLSISCLCASTLPPSLWRGNGVGVLGAREPIELLEA